MTHVPFKGSDDIRRAFQTLGIVTPEQRAQILEQGRVSSAGNADWLSAQPSYTVKVEKHSRALGNSAPAPD